MIRHRWLIRIGISSAIVFALAIFIFWLLVPRIVQHALLTRLVAVGLENVRLDVSRVTPWNAELKNFHVAGGDDQIQNISVRYTPSLLWQGQIDEVTLRGVQLHIGLRDGKVDPKLQLKPAGNDSQSGDAFTLPLQRIELDSSTIYLELATASIAIPVKGSLARQPDGKFAAELQLTLAGKPLSIRGTVGPGKNDADLSASAAQVDASTVGTILSSLAPASHLSGGGTTSLDAQFHHGIDGSNLSVKLGPQDITVAFAAPDSTHKPTNIHGIVGVFNLDVGFGSSGPGATLAIRDTAFDSQSLGVSAEKINSTIAFEDLFRLVTKSDQQIKIGRLNVGKFSFTNGDVLFNADGAKNWNVSKTTWLWLSGAVAGENISIQGSHAQGTILLDHLDLHQLLAFFAPEEADGDGMVNGRIPFVLDGSEIRLGDGVLTALPGGILRVKDTKTVGGVLGFTQLPVETREQLLEALSNLKYDIMEGNTRYESGRLVVPVHIVGRGQTGARKAVDLLLNVKGLDDAIRVYLGIQKGMSSIGNRH